MGGLGTQAAPRRHPEGTQEAPRRHPGGTQEPPRRPETTRRQNRCFYICFFQQKCASDHFCIDGSDVTITVYRACAQDLVMAWASKADHTIPNTEDTPPEPLQQRLFGEYTCGPYLLHLLFLLHLMEYILYSRRPPGRLNGGGRGADAPPDPPIKSAWRPLRIQDIFHQIQPE